MSGNDLSGLETAIKAVNADRGFLLAAVDAVQKGATALDRADEACIGGRRSAAQDAEQAAQPLSQKAREAVSVLARRVSAYRASLRSLAQASPAVDGPDREALTAVVRDGEAEAAGVERFRIAVAALWPRYDELEQVVGVWVTRARAGWYRTDQEGAGAYAILIEAGRPGLDTARDALSAAAQAVRGPSAAQSATLAAADRTLSGLRAP